MSTESRKVSNPNHPSAATRSFHRPFITSCPSLSLCRRLCNYFPPVPVLTLMGSPLEDLCMRIFIYFLAYKATTKRIFSSGPTAALTACSTTATQGDTADSAKQSLMLLSSTLLSMCTKMEKHGIFSPLQENTTKPSALPLLQPKWESE